MGVCEVSTVTLCAFSDEAGAPLATQIKCLLENGIYRTELRSIDGVNVGDLSEDAARRAARELTDAGISVFSIGSPLGKTSLERPLEEQKKLLAHLLRLAEIFGTKRIRVFSYYAEPAAYKAVEEEVISRLRALVAAAPGYRLALENDCGLFGATVENCLTIASRVPGLARVYDPANFILSGEDIRRARETLAGGADYYHIKDAVRETGEIVPAGMGDCEIDTLIREIRGDITLTVEPHLHVFDGYALIDKKELRNRFTYASQEESFRAAADAVKGLLTKNGYTERERGLWKK